jgi:hypothetical protein
VEQVSQVVPPFFDTKSQDTCRNINEDGWRAAKGAKQKGIRVTTSIDHEEALVMVPGF